MTRRLRLGRVVLPLLLLLAACAEDAPQDTLEPKGPIAREIDNLVNPVFIVAGVVFVIVEFGMLFLLWRFRRRKDDDDTTAPAQIHGSSVLEWGWTIVPALILLFVGIGTVATVFAVQAKADDTTMSVEVIGQQWWWEFRYDTDGDGETDIVTANDLVVPAGQAIGLDVQSRDVIHSFWIPALNGKKDAVPGRTHELVVEADEPGTYVGQCTEYCGLSHAYMRQRLVALSEPDFEAWVANQVEDADMPSDGDAAAGADLFTTTCSSCHLARGVNDDEFAEEVEANPVAPGSAFVEPGVAPDLTHFATRGAFAGATFDLWVDQDDDAVVDWDEITGDGAQLNRDDLEAWLRDPPAEKPMAATLDDPHSRGMPNYNLSEEQIDLLVTFLETLD
ncbi:MAG: cytochrome c oxidase subunit II [Acidimicrobiales bacterium]